MNYKYMKSVYTFSCILLCLIFLAPTLAVSLPPIGEEEFSELWLLGPNHMMEDYPSSIFPGEIYHVFLGVSNHMGGLEYYLIKVKLRTQSESMPDKSAGTSSALPAVYEYRIILQSNAIWENEITFSLNNVSVEENFARISTILIDGNPLSVDKIAQRDKDNGGLYLEIFFELWIYNSTISIFQYHNRFVSFWMNITG